MEKITSIGEILFDIYPGRKTLGGAPFNFIYHIKKLTGAGNFISRIGDDELGRLIHLFLTKNNISMDNIQVDKLLPTGTAKAVLNEQKIPEWVIELNRAYDNIESNDKLYTLIDKETDCLYFGTLAQREEQSRTTVQSLFNRNIKYFCDLNIRQHFFSKETIDVSLKTSNVLKVNEDELKLINKIILNKKYDLIKCSKLVLHQYNIELLCVTLGSGGAFIFNKNCYDHYKINVKDIKDTVGAGDAYASILCLGYLQNWDINKINRIANSFAAEIIKIDGALPEDDSIYSKYKNMIAL